MATGLVIQSLAGAVPNELLALIKDVLKKSFACKENCKRLQKTLEGIIPVLDDAFKSSVELSQPSQKMLGELYQQLREGQKLVTSCSKVRRLNIYSSYKYANKIQGLDSYIVDFTQKKGWAHICSEVHSLRVQQDQLVTMGHRMEVKLENIEHKVEDKLEEIGHKIDAVREESDLKFIADQMDQFEIGKRASQSSVPELPDFRVGLKGLVYELKKRLLRNDAPLLGVIGMGGSGKTTVAIALCNNNEVKGHFKERIVFERVSQSPNLKGLLERMWDKIVREKRPEFHDVEDAHQQLQQRLRQMEPQPTLVVLDDVWEIDHLEKLLFEGKGYKTLVTTRNNNVVKSDYRYDLPCLREQDAVSLFCFSAFDRKSIPDTADGNLVKEVIAECKGLPLALKVIGRSLHDQPPAAWITAKDKLSQGQTISEYHKTEVLKRMATSIDILEEDVRECFLDMGIFPEARKMSADPLLDLGVYVHKLKWTAAYTILIELASRNLVTLVNNQKGTLGNPYGCSGELSLIQHDVLRDLSIYWTEQEPIIERRKRFIMPQKVDSIRKMWKKHAERDFNAEIVSFHTGSMEEKDWCQMKFPNAKALILNFSASEYFLPPFMQSMDKLKVLIIVNHNSKRATLKGISVLSSLTRLKVIRLERVIVPPLQEYCQSWQKLEKLSLVLCEGCGNTTGLHMGAYLNFPRLLELAIDHCSDLRELSTSICSLTTLKRLSVTNCHDLQKLSEDIGNLSSLQMLKLYACPSLKELPDSVCKLRQLQFLDISLCGHLKQLPDQLGQLSSLKELDMRECSRVKQLPRSARDLRSLVHVICDEKIRHQWSSIKVSAIPSLRVEVAEEHFHLDWLED